VNLYAHLDNILQCNPNNYHIISGDFNFECNDTNLGYRHFKDIISNYNLVVVTVLLLIDLLITLTFINR